MIRRRTAVFELQARELAFRLQLCRTGAVQIRGITCAGVHAGYVCIAAQGGDGIVSFLRWAGYPS